MTHADRTGRPLYNFGQRRYLALFGLYERGHRDKSSHLLPCAIWREKLLLEDSLVVHRTHEDADDVNRYSEVRFGSVND